MMNAKSQIKLPDAAGDARVVNSNSETLRGAAGQMCNQSLNADHYVKLIVLAPFMFGKPMVGLKWINCLHSVDLLVIKNRQHSVEELMDRELDLIQLMEKGLEIVNKHIKDFPEHEVEKMFRTMVICEEVEPFDYKTLLTEAHKCSVITGFWNKMSKYYQNKVFESRFAILFILKHYNNQLKTNSLENNIQKKIDRDRKIVQNDHKAGNKAFKNSNFYEAVALYTSAIKRCGQGGDTSQDSVAVVLRNVQNVHLHAKNEPVVSVIVQNDHKAGNKAFKNNNFYEAVALYTSAIKRCSLYEVLYGNRAQAYLRLNKFRSALSDAKRAITIKPDYSKGVYRCAQAYYKMKLYDKALYWNNRAFVLCKRDDGDSSLMNEVIEQENVIHRELAALNNGIPEEVQPDSDSDDVPELISSDSEGEDEDDDHTKKQQVASTNIKKAEPRRDTTKQLIGKKAETSRDTIKQSSGKTTSNDPKPKSVKQKTKKSVTVTESVTSISGTQVVRQISVGYNDNIIHSAFTQTESFSFSHTQPPKSKESEDTPVPKSKKRSSKPVPKRKESISKDDLCSSVPSGLKDFPWTSSKETRNESNSDVSKPRPEVLKPESKIPSSNKDTNTDIPHVKAKRPVQVDKMTQLENYLQKGSDFYFHDQARAAIVSYQHAFSVIAQITDSDTGNKLLKVDLHTIICLKYAYGKACLDINIAHRIYEAIDKFQDIVSMTEPRDRPVAQVQYGIAKAYTQLFRFHDAVEFLQLSEQSLQQSESITALKPWIFWPGTNVSFSDMDVPVLRGLLRELVTLCCCPPKPDAICRVHTDVDDARWDIYIADPDFKGFVRLHCEFSCFVDFHPVCWKEFSHSQGKKHRHKDFLSQTCLTPDCSGKIMEIEIYKPQTDVKRIIAAEKNAPREKKPPKPRFKMAPLSDINLTRKLERKKLRKQKQHGYRSARQEISQDSTAAATDSDVKNKKSSSRPKSGPPIGTSVIMDQKNMAVLKKPDLEEEDIDTAKARGARRKKTRAKQSSSMSAAIPLYVTFNDENRVLQSEFTQAMDDELDDDSAMSADYQSAVDHLFSVPDHLQEEVNLFNDDWEVLRDPTVVRFNTCFDSDVTDTIQETLYSFFAGILEKNGPLPLDDPVLLNELHSFPAQAKELVDAYGGLKQFLLSSGQFAVLRNNWVSLLRDVAKASEMGRSTNYSYPGLHNPSYDEDVVIMNSPSNDINRNQSNTSPGDFSRLDDLDSINSDYDSCHGDDDSDEYYEDSEYDDIEGPQQDDYPYSKPCVFCGAEPEYDNYDVPTHLLACRNCGHLVGASPVYDSDGNMVPCRSSDESVSWMVNKPPGPERHSTSSDDNVYMYAEGDSQEDDVATDEDLDESEEEEEEDVGIIDEEEEEEEEDEDDNKEDSEDLSDDRQAILNSGDDQDMDERNNEETSGSLNETTRSDIATENGVHLNKITNTTLADSRCMSESKDTLCNSETHHSILPDNSLSNLPNAHTCAGNPICTSTGHATVTDGQKDLIPLSNHRDEEDYSPSSSDSTDTTLTYSEEQLGTLASEVKIPFAPDIISEDSCIIEDSISEKELDVKFEEVALTGRISCDGEQSNGPIIDDEAENEGNMDIDLRADDTLSTEHAAPVVATDLNRKSDAGTSSDMTGGGSSGHSTQPQSAKLASGGISDLEESPPESKQQRNVGLSERVSKEVAKLLKTVDERFALDITKSVVDEIATRMHLSETEKSQLYEQVYLCVQQDTQKSMQTSVHLGDLCNHHVPSQSAALQSGDSISGHDHNQNKKCNGDPVVAEHISITNDDDDCDDDDNDAEDHISRSLLGNSTSSSQKATNTIKQFLLDGNHEKMDVVCNIDSMSKDPSENEKSYDSSKSLNSVPSTAFVTPILLKQSQSMPHPITVPLSQSHSVSHPITAPLSQSQLVSHSVTLPVSQSHSVSHPAMIPLSQSQSVSCPVTSPFNQTQSVLHPVSTLIQSQSVSHSLTLGTKHVAVQARPSTSHRSTLTEQTCESLDRDNNETKLRCEGYEDKCTSLEQKLLQSQNEVVALKQIYKEHNEKATISAAQYAELERVQKADQVKWQNDKLAFIDRVKQMEAQVRSMEQVLHDREEQLNNSQEMAAWEKNEASSNLKAVTTKLNSFLELCSHQRERAKCAEVQVLQTILQAGIHELQYSQDLASDLQQTILPIISRCRDNGEDIPANVQATQIKLKAIHHTCSQYIKQCNKDFAIQIGRIEGGDEMSVLPPMTVPTAPKVPSLPGDIVKLLVMSKQEGNPVLAGASSSQQGGATQGATAASNAPFKSAPASLRSTPNISPAASHPSSPTPQQQPLGSQRNTPPVTSQKTTPAIVSQIVNPSVASQGAPLKPQPMPQRQRKSSPSGGAEAAGSAQATNASQPPMQTRAGKSSVEKLISQLEKIFPNYSSGDFTKLLSDLRRSRGTLSGMSMTQIITSITDTILEKERLTAQSDNSRPQQRSDGAAGFSKPLRSPPGLHPEWARLDSEDELCVICHEELTRGSTVRLECSHSFHTQCIRRWLRQQSTCPNCRCRALMPDEFPALQ